MSQVVAVVLLGISSAHGNEPTATDDAQRQADLQAARACFERNLDAIRNRDRDAYLATYWQSESLARTGWGGIETGYAGHEAGATGNWPDVFDAQRLQLVWLQPGVVYGSYRFRVVYGQSESAGISERIFRRAADGWRIAMTSAFAAPEGVPPPPMAFVGGTLVDPRSPPVANATVVVRSGYIDCAGSADSCVVPDDMRIVDARGLWITPGLIDTGVHLSQSGWVDARPDLFDLHGTFSYDNVAAGLQASADARLHAYVQCGVTAILDRGGFPWTWELRASRSTTRPAVAACGPALATRATYPKLVASLQELAVRDSTDIELALSYLESRGADAIVYHWDDDAPQENVAAQFALLRRIGKGVRARQRTFLVESGRLAGAKAAVDAGAHLVTGVWDADLDEEFLHAARRVGTAYCPTLTATANEARTLRAALAGKVASVDDPFGVIDSTTTQQLASTGTLLLAHAGRDALQKRLDTLEARAEQLRANARRAHQAGLPLVLGSGAGRPFQPHAAAVFAELEALEACIVDATTVLSAATSQAARFLHDKGNRGVLRQGAIADLLLLEADPTANIAHLRRQVAVMRAGELRWH